MTHGWASPTATLAIVILLLRSLHKFLDNEEDLDLEEEY